MQNSKIYQPSAATIAKMCNEWRKYRATCGHDIWMSIFESCDDYKKYKMCDRLVVHHTSCCPPDKLSFVPGLCAGCKASPDWVMIMTQRYLDAKKLDLRHKRIADFDNMHFQLMEWSGVPYITKNAIHERVMNDWIHSRRISNIETEMVRAGACTRREASSEYRKFWERP
ncbi:hypothetical protein Daesc_005142 [Daldinia eschscholtzii]|uniref:TAZ-type domain-containing protein n=1 Tax=Daldinia eschscholtzii TaxID=292717 RepID=A0AAX6MJL6_9PEZI